MRERCSPEGDRCIWWMVGKRRRAVDIGSLSFEEDWRERCKISKARNEPTECPARIISSKPPFSSSSFSAEREE